ncbi:STAS domain-containing protein [Nonomuraea dietziae]|uniref:STAS domain-containing protein n=1 Tax=Nonomuraea dietziae TaxID=65515 RepID=UPI0034127713
MTTLDLWMVRDPSGTDLFLAGELDANSSPLLPPAIATAMEGGCRRLTVDATDLAFCDSSGLRALLQDQRSVTSAGASMELANVHGMLGRVLEVTGLSKAFTLTSTTS